MNIWLSMVHVSLPGRLLITMPWLSLAVLSMLLHYRTPPRPLDDKKADIISSIGWSILLLIAGGVIGLLVLQGSTVLIGIFAASYSCAPWHRLRLCRQHPVSASLLMCGGGALVLTIYRHHVEFMFMPIAAWILGVSSFIALLKVTQKQPTARQPENKGALPVQP